MGRRDILIDTRKLTDSVNVGFSCGKDSLATLAMCVDTFDHVFPFFMFIVPKLRFQERYIDLIERRFNVKVIRVPHWGLAGMLRCNAYRPGSRTTRHTPDVRLADMEREIASRTGCNWFAYGSTKYDSMERNAMLKGCGGVDVRLRRCYPLMHYTETMIYSYLRHHHIPLPSDYAMFGRSFGALWAAELTAIKRRFPRDYERIQEYFPHVEAIVKRAELDQIPDVRAGDDATEPA